MKIPRTKARMAKRAKARNKNRNSRRNYKLKKRQQKYDYNTSLQSMKGKTLRHNVGWAAATAINERQALAQENVAKAKANKTYRFGADIITRQDNDVNADDQVLDWIK